MFILASKTEEGLTKKQRFVKYGIMICKGMLHKMKLDFIRFQTTDNIELQGWLSNVDGDTAVVHMHGMSGNGYENAFLDTLHATYNKLGLSFFSIDNRGRGIISSFWQNGNLSPWGEGTKLGGSCFEILDECVHDIAGAINYLKSIGKTKFILQGHSLGCTKVIHFMNTLGSDDILKVILLAPTDMVAWASRDKNHEANVEKAKQLIADDKPTALVDAQCWPDETPLSAQTYLSICVAGSPADIYGDRDNGALLGKVHTPMLIAYGSDDIGITQVDGSIDAWKTRADAVIDKTNTQIAIIDGASHSFRHYEGQLSQAIERFVV